MTVRVVTDSTAYLPAAIVADAGLTVVPLTVAVDGDAGFEGVEVAPADVARALVQRRGTVTTSRPSPAQFSEAYRRLFDAGATGVVSVHLSARLSGTYEAALLAASEFDGAVTVVDTAAAGMAVGFVAVRAAETAAGGADLATVRARAAAAAGNTSTLFYVDTLEYMRRGGRISAASALLGTALSVKPILQVTDGEVRLREKVRTAGRALARLVELSVVGADDCDVDVAVQHLEAAERANALLDAVTARLGGRIRAAHMSEVSATVAAHTGPGVIGVSLYRHA
jgi:DegV family protein with EDD domain